MSKLWRTTRKKILLYRLAVQSFILLLTLALGLQFWRFVEHYKSGGLTPPVDRPEGVEAFLPIGGFTSLKYWLLSGEIHPFHPAALFLFVAAILVSVVLKKGFCGWICPVGFMSEWVYKPWKKFFGKNVELPRWGDIPLRGLKYLVLGFFVWAIGFKMTEPMLKEFLDGDYWKIADLKMLRFFTDISAFALWTVVILTVLSIPIRNFWCRYLCPYGALLGLTSLLSPFKIRRDNDLCTHCKNCTRNCPAYLPVEARAKITSPECTSCLTCLAGCPTGALSFATASLGTGKKKFTLSGKVYPLILLAIFFGIVLFAKLSGNWESQIPEADMLRLAPEAAELAHPR